MSLENVKARLREAGITDLSPENLLRIAKESGSPHDIKVAQRHFDTDKRYRKALEEFEKKNEKGEGHE